MRLFLDSTDLRNDGESLRMRMDADGYLHLPVHKIRARKPEAIDEAVSRLNRR